MNLNIRIILISHFNSRKDLIFNKVLLSLSCINGLNFTIFELVV